MNYNKLLNKFEKCLSSIILLNISKRFVLNLLKYSSSYSINLSYIASNLILLL